MLCVKRIANTASVALGFFGRNLSPLSESGVPPLAIITGRRIVLPFATAYHCVPGPDSSTPSMPAREMNTKRITTKRATVIQYECIGVIRKFLTHPLRAHADQVRAHADQVCQKDHNSQASRWKVCVRVSDAYHI